MDTMTILLATLMLTVFMMGLTWWWAVKIENFGIIDAIWSFAFLIHAGIFYLFSDSDPTRKMVFFLMIGLWSFRLGYFLSRRIASHHPHEDTRYIKLRQEYGVDYKKRFFIFFMYQAISVSILTLPFIFVFKNTNTGLSPFEIAGFIVWLLAVIGESVADHQMNIFKADPKNKGQVCNIGLWNYSRHPNYFFESCIWWGFFIFMLGTSGLVWSIYAPLVILGLLLYVTGVPPSEVQSIKSRGDLYRKYQKTTSVFIPWFPKKDV